ncbi:MAG: DUF4382 domain-containing protein [Pseudomonadota bacterium]
MTLLTNDKPNQAARNVASRWLATLLAALTLSLTACGGGGAQTEPLADEPLPPIVEEQGELMVTITDAEGDFVAYAVDVVSLTMEKANGDQVETLPLSTRIDFTELTEVTELLSIATVPAGNYESVVMTLDYGAADIIVQDENGDSVTATAVDANGDTLGLFDVRLNLSNSDVIRIAPGVPAAFSLDFDLDASNEIDLTIDPTVTVEAFLLATAELETDREHRVRGALVSVDEIDNSFVLNVRPFRHRIGDFGQFDVTTDDQTQYEVDGTGYTGSEGLVALAALNSSSPVIANGAIAGRSIAADTVIAGSSVPWTDGDVVKGVVAARDGDAITLRGARVEYRDGVEIFRGFGTVTLGAGTTVTAPGVDNDALTIDSVSVGQRVVAFGELVDDQTLDATSGRVVMLMNQLTAEVVNANPLAVDVYFLNGRRPTAFDFAGTGVDASFDANADEYDIDTGPLSLDALMTGDLVRVRGLVTPFGTAPADYTAQTLIDVNTEARPGSFNVVWAEGSSMPFHSLTEQMIDIDLSASREILTVRGVPRAVTNPLDSAILSPTENGQGIYAVKVRGSGELHLYREFSELVAELDAQLDAGAQLYRVTAHVRYTDDSNEWVTPRASFVFRAAGE